MDEVNSGSEQIASSSPSSVAPQESSAPSERTFRQSEVNDIVKKVKQEAVDTYRRMESERPDYVREKYGSLPNQTQPQHNDEHYRKIAAEEAQRLRDVWVQEAQQKAQDEYAHRTVQNFNQKVEVGRKKFEDFDKVVGDVAYGKFPNVVQLVGDYIENGADVLYELGKDRMKLAQLELLAQMSPQDAVVQAQRLSKSLLDNEKSTNVRMPNEPLSQLKPSNAGMDDGVMTVTDFRKKYRA